MEKVGREGVVYIEESKTDETYLEGCRRNAIRSWIQIPLLCYQ
jgi:hypothetical protein